MRNWQANHQLKLHSQDEAEQCALYNGPQVDVMIVAVTLCLIWCHLLSSTGQILYEPEALEMYLLLHLPQALHILL